MVCYRAHVYPNVNVSIKASKDAYYVRNVEYNYPDYVDKVSPLVEANLIDILFLDKRDVVTCIARTDSISRRRSSANTLITAVLSARNSKMQT